MTHPTYTVTAAGLLDVDGEERKALLLESDFTDAIKAGAALMFQEVAIVPADELARLTAKVKRLEEQRDEVAIALMSLERRATRVSDLGATTGKQWTQLTIGLLAARSVLSNLPTPIDRTRAALIDGDAQ